MHLMGVATRVKKKKPWCGKQMKNDEIRANFEDFAVWGRSKNRGKVRVKDKDIRGKYGLILPQFSIIKSTILIMTKNIHRLLGCRNKFLFLPYLPVGVLSARVVQKRWTICLYFHVALSLSIWMVKVARLSSVSPLSPIPLLKEKFLTSGSNCRGNIFWRVGFG